MVHLHGVDRSNIDLDNKSEITYTKSSDVTQITDLEPGNCCVLHDIELFLESKRHVSAVLGSDYFLLWDNSPLFQQSR